MKLALAIALLLTACGPDVWTPIAPPPRERPDADAATCPDACARLAALDCDEAKPTPGGATCERVCRNIQESGATALDLACVVRAASCAAANACGYGVEQ